MNWLYGCGEMYTTVEDMKKLDEAIMDGKLLSKQSVSDMFSASPARKYGFSFYIYPDYYHNHGVLAGGTLLIILTGINERLSYYFLTSKMV